MSAFLSDLDLIFNFLVTCFSYIYGLFQSSPLLMSVLALWVLDRIFGIFDLIKG